MIPYSAKYVVACNNHEPGALVRKECKVGCIGCRLCQNKVESSPFVVEDNLSSVDYSKDMSILLSALYGGVLSGVGIGMVMKSGSNTGGTDIIAQIIARYTPLSLGTALFIVDGVIIAVSAFFFGIEKPASDFLDAL